MLFLCVASRRAWAFGRPSSAVAKFHLWSDVRPAGMRDHVRGAGCRVPGAEVEAQIVRGFD